MATQRQNRGLVKIGKNQTAVTSIPFPSLRPDYLLVKTVAVALNPADWQNLDEDFEPGAEPLLLGHDVAGIVEGVGQNLTKRWKLGDRIICCAHGGKSRCDKHLGMYV
jgi:NADPH:quinone reductase-like Zn-dependent oxidoreductase